MKKTEDTRGSGGPNKSPRRIKGRIGSKIPAWPL
jgi:hypothetical protein